MLRNPIHKRMEKLDSWQLLTFSVCLCERMFPNYQAFCTQTGFADPLLYRRIMDLVWETLVVKGVKINFDNQLEKLEQAIPSADNYDIYGVYPAIDACIALGEVVHALLSGEMLEHAIAVSEISLRTVGMLEMTHVGREMSDDELKVLPAIQDELDLQWEIYRLLSDCEERDLELIKGLKFDLREANMSNIGVELVQ